MGAEWVRACAESGTSSRIALIGQTAADVRDVMVEGESGILAVSPPWFRPDYQPSRRRLVWPNGCVAMTYSGDEPDQLRGPQHFKAWCDEPAKWRYLQSAWDNLEMGLRLGDSPQIVATTTPRPIAWLKQTVADPQTMTRYGRTLDNAANLNPKAVARMQRKYAGTRLGRQELDGEILDDNPNALWRREEDIEKQSVSESAVPQLTRIVVGVDPQAADNQDDDGGGAETGIVVVGRADRNGVPHAYVLADLTVRKSPDGWGGAAVDGYQHFRADRIVAEVNNGGAMVEYVLRSVAKARRAEVSYKSVHASVGKRTRAEPVAALYEQKRVHHVGAFPELEDQMCGWQPSDKVSPDRMDALVWAVTELMLSDSEPEELVVSNYVGGQAARRRPRDNEYY